MQANNIQIHPHTTQTQLIASYQNKKHFKPPSHFYNSTPHFFIPPTLATNYFHPSILSQPQGNPLVRNWPFKPINSLNGSKPKCQICGKFGHTALICHHRANLHYQPPSLKNFNTIFTAFSLRPSSFATSSPIRDPSWFMDSRVTHHFTPDISMIQNLAPFIGNEQVMVGNGKKIPISHYGNSLLFFSSSPLKLNNILHAPALSNKIISVSKLCADNTTFVEFYHDFFLVKDQVSKKVLLQGQLVNGLYQVSAASKPPISSLSKVFLFSTQETNLWHHRLGHFSRCVLTRLARLAFD